MHPFRYRAPLRIGPLICALGLLLSVFAHGEDASQPITRVEEDWQLKIGVPSPEENAPQVFVVTSPTGDRDSVHAMFEINHVTLPDYFDGGLQLQMWNADEPISMRHHPNLRSLATPNEQVNFTVSMQVSEGQLTYCVKDGTSSTWGDFGGDSLTLSRATELVDLSAYSSAKSVEFSRVGFAAHRVKSFSLNKVRYYSGDTLVRTESSSQSVFQSSDLNNVAGDTP